MWLSDLLADIKYEIKKGDAATEVTELIYDSRRVTKGCVFLCISGTTVDAHRFIPDAVAKGAAAIVVEKDIEVEGNVTVVCVDSARYALACMSAAFFDYPSKKMITIGLTGTKGKTTTSYMIQEILKKAGKKVGVIGTNGTMIGEKHYVTENTTPESYEVQQFFYEMVKEGCEYAIMEVSSQGLKMDRVAGFTFDYGIFTNLSPDHIGPNEHADMAEYIYCKSLLFQRCKYGLANMDDEHYEEVTKGHTCTMETYGFSKGADYHADHMELLSAPGFLGVGFDVKGKIHTHVKVNIPGRFSIYNALSALSVCHSLGIEDSFILKGLEEIKVKGRVEIVPYSDDFTVLIDYAHNAVSMESILTTLREYHPNRIISLFGCGGNRSKLRRYEMGEISGKLADLSVITEDNSRLEKIEDILADIKIGLSKTNGKFVEIPDRVDAIHYALDHAEKGDIIALLGKGHEEYRDCGGVKTHFSELEEVLKYAASKQKES